MSRTIFIWDIHWCFDEFMALLEKIKFDYNIDNLYLTWDLIAKWPKSKEVLDFLINHPKIKSVKWNVDWYFEYFIDTWKFVSEKVKNKFWEEFENLKNIFEAKHMEYLKSLPLFIEKDKWVLIHGWLLPWKSLQEHKIEEITMIRMIEWKPWYEYYNWEKIVIYWHWSKDWVRIRKNTKWLDSGCFRWWYLTAYIFETQEIVQQLNLGYVK